MIVKLSDKENTFFYQILELLSKNLCARPTIVQMETDDLLLNAFTRTVIYKNKTLISLTAKEFDLLYFLYLHKGQVFSKEQLYENVWGFENMPKDTSNLPSFIRKLRKKIEPDPDNPIYIITVWGVGYKFNEQKP